MQERTASNRTSQFHSHFLTQTSTQTHLSGKLSIFHIQHFSSAAKLLAVAAAGKAAKYTQFLLHVAYVCVRADVSVRGAHTHTRTICCMSEAGKRFSIDVFFVVLSIFLSIFHVEFFPPLESTHPSRSGVVNFR